MITRITHLRNRAWCVLFIFPHSPDCLTSQFEVWIYVGCHFDDSYWREREREKPFFTLDWKVNYGPLFNLQFKSKYLRNRFVFLLERKFEQMRSKKWLIIYHTKTILSFKRSAFLLSMTRDRPVKKKSHKDDCVWQVWWRLRMYA